MCNSDDFACNVCQSKVNCNKEQCESHTIMGYIGIHYGDMLGLVIRAHMDAFNLNTFHCHICKLHGLKYYVFSWMTRAEISSKRVDFNSILVRIHYRLGVEINTKFWSEYSFFEKFHAHILDLKIFILVMSISIAMQT